MNVIKRHKGLAIVGSLTLILLIVMFAIVSKIIFSNGESVYGPRLDGIAKLDKNITKEIVNTVNELEEVENIKIRTQGSIIRTIIIFKKGTNLNKAKEIASETLTKYDEDITADYNFEYYLKENVVDDKETEEVEEGFASTGTKHPKKDKITWTR